MVILMIPTRVIYFFKIATLSLALLIGLGTLASASIFGPVLDDTETHINSVISKAGNQMGLTEANTLNNMIQLISTLRSEFKDDLDKDMNNINSQLAASIMQMHDNVMQINGDITSQKAQIQASASKLVSQIAFWRPQVPFSVTGIENQVISKLSGEYKLTVFGTGFGIDEGTQKYDLRVSFYGQELPQSSISPLADGVEIVLPHDMVDALFLDTQPHRIPVDFEDSISRECALAWRIVGRTRCSDHYKTTFAVTLAPRIAATATLESSKDGVSDGAVKVVEGPPVPLRAIITLT